MHRLQQHLQENYSSSQGSHDALKAELVRRDDTIQKLRREVLHLQEERDAHQLEVGQICCFVHLFVSVNVGLALSYTDLCINCKRRYCICLFSQKVVEYWKTSRSSQIGKVYFV